MLNDLCVWLSFEQIYAHVSSLSLSVFLSRKAHSPAWQFTAPPLCTSLLLSRMSLGCPRVDREIYMLDKAKATHIAKEATIQGDRQTASSKLQAPCSMLQLKIWRAIEIVKRPTLRGCVAKNRLKPQPIDFRIGWGIDWVDFGRWFSNV